MKPIRLLLLLASFWTLSGCALPGLDTYPTPIPPDVLPTAIYQTAAAANATMIALTPSATPSPTLELPTPTLTLVPTITSTPTGIPPAPRAKIFIAAPGPMSKVASPLQLRMEVVAGETQLVDISLFGEDDRLIAHNLERVLSEPPTAAYLALKIPFEVRAAELARLQVSTKDRAGRIESLSTTFILLLPVGQSEITPAPPPFERAAIYLPAVEAQVSGGILAIEGAMWPLNNDQPVVLELLDEDGRVLIEKLLSLTGDTYVPFSTTIPFTVYEATRAQLVVRQADGRSNALVYLYSQIVILNP